MTFKELIEQGWARHDTQSQALADDLESHRELLESDEQVEHFLRLANHTIGEHLGDWPRARDLALTALGQRQPNAKLAASYSDLAVAQFMTGNAIDAAQSEAISASLVDGPAITMPIRTKITLALALAASGQVDAAAGIYRATLAIAQQTQDPLPSDRVVAVNSNNLAGELLDLDEPTQAQQALMLEAAEGARVFWERAGTWVNVERAEYLLALVRNAIGAFDAALTHADVGLGLIADNGDEQVDAVFLQLARANALRGLDRAGDAEQSLMQADAGAAEFPNDGLKQWYADERKKVVG